MHEHVNVDHFDELPDEMKNSLLEYINLNFSVQQSFNRKHTSYGLKQHFTSTYGASAYHVTSECFSEAMVAAGFRRKRTEQSESNWYFDARVPKLLKP